MVVLSTAYLPPISYMSTLVQHRGALLEANEHFEKQSYRNRCVIFGANGLQNLTVPVMHATKRQPIKELRISYAENWPDNHLRSLESAYNSSAFFDVLGDELLRVLQRKPQFLFDLNLELLHILLDWLQEETLQIAFTTHYQTAYPGHDDVRHIIHPKKPSLMHQPEAYYQPFAARHGFQPDLSVIDLIFAEGRAAWDYLKAVNMQSHISAT